MPGVKKAVPAKKKAGLGKKKAVPSSRVPKSADAFLFTGKWCKIGGLTGKDKMQEVVRGLGIRWETIWITRCARPLPKSKLATPKPNPQSRYKPGQFGKAGHGGYQLCYVQGEEVAEDVFKLTLEKGLPDELRERLAP